MKLKDGFILRRFADKWIAVSANELADTRNTLITLNKTAAFVWEQLQNDTDRDTLIAALMTRFDVEEADPAADVDRFLKSAQEAGLLNE